MHIWYTVNGELLFNSEQNTCTAFYIKCVLVRTTVNNIQMYAIYKRTYIKMHNNESLVRLNVQPTGRLAAHYCWHMLFTHYD